MLLLYYFLDLVQCLVCRGAQQKIPQNFPGKRSPQNDPGGKIWPEHWALDSQMGQVQSLFNFCHTSIVQVKKRKMFLFIKAIHKNALQMSACCLSSSSELKHGAHTHKLLYFHHLCAALSRMSTENREKWRETRRKIKWRPMRCFCCW